MRVELFYFAGCPNWTVAEDRLTEALLTVGRDDITLVRNKVDTPAAARAAGFTGSPTIRIDDRDPFATDEQVGLSCRVYSTPDGLSGSPTVDQFIEALSLSGSSSSSSARTCSSPSPTRPPKRQER